MSVGIMASMPYTNKYKVTPVEVQTEVRYAHKGNSKIFFTCHLHQDFLYVLVSDFHCSIHLSAIGY